MATIVGAGTVNIHIIFNNSNNNDIVIHDNILLVVKKITPTITLSSTIINKTYGDAPFSLSDFVSTNSPGVFSFLSSDLNVISISGNMATIVGGGIATINVTVSSSSNYNGASKNINVIVNQITPSLILSPINKTYGDSPILLSNLVSTNSSGSLLFTSNDQNVATISGNTLTITGGGTTTINVLLNSSNNHTSVSATMPLVVSKAKIFQYGMFQVLLINHLLNSAQVHLLHQEIILCGLK